MGLLVQVTYLEIDQKAAFGDLAALRNRLAAWTMFMRAGRTSTPQFSFRKRLAKMPAEMHHAKAAEATQRC